MRDEQELRGEVDRGERDIDARRLLDPDDVEADEQGDDDRADDDVPRVLPQRPPEDRQVVRDEERRDGDRDDVVEHLRPRRPERRELVEGVAREARRAARFRIPDRPLGIRGRRRREEDAGDDEDERRQPEGEECGDAEGVVDRRSDVSVRRREKRVRSEDALEVLLLAAPPGHAVTVVRLPANGPVAIITRQGASRRMERTSSGNARRKPEPGLDRRADDDQLGPVVASPPRRARAPRARSRVRTIRRVAATPYDSAIAAARASALPERRDLVGRSARRAAAPAARRAERRGRRARGGLRRAGRRGRAHAPSRRDRAAVRRCSGSGWRPSGAPAGGPAAKRSEVRPAHQSSW